MRAGERVELESLRSFFGIPGAPGTIRESGDAVAVRADGTRGRALHRIVGIYDLVVLEELAGIYAERKFWVSLDPAAGLDDELVERGFVPDGAWQKFERGVEPAGVSRTDLVIDDARAPDDFGAVIAATWGLPPPERSWMSALVALPRWHCFVGYDGAQPVAGGALFEAEDTGWLGTASTLPSHRGRGAQGAILAARIARAAQLGLRRVVTETDAPEEGGPNQSYRNILRAGFEPSYLRPNYTSASAGS
jgi:GNAT superfamily N-acetyltransferase